MATLVLTVIGDDRSGLVDALSGVIADHGGNWDESHMTELAGKFAGIVRVTVPDARADALVDALKAPDRGDLLDITVTRASTEEPAGRLRQVSLELVGQDHPGIIHDISHALAQRDVSIHDLRTETVDAPMAGGTLFQAWAVLEIPAGLAIAELSAGLEALANELMVDIDLHEPVTGEATPT